MNRTELHQNLLALYAAITAGEGERARELVERLLREVAPAGDSHE